MQQSSARIEGPFPPRLLGMGIQCGTCHLYGRDCIATEAGHGPCDLIYVGRNQNDEYLFQGSRRWLAEFRVLAMVGGTHRVTWWAWHLGFCTKCWAPQPGGLYSRWLKTFRHQQDARVEEDEYAY